MASSVSSKQVCSRCHVSGRVQGVAYRASAAARARELAISGYARNLPDGRVEILAYGEAAAVRVFIAWLWIGPAAAKVTEVAVETLQLAEPPREFIIA